LNIIPQQLQIGDEIAAKELTQSGQQKEASNRCDSANVSVISVAAFVDCPMPDVVPAGSKSRLHTKHLAGNTVSRTILKNGLAQL
jgi:hypothetical protein